MMKPIAAWSLALLFAGLTLPGACSSDPPADGQSTADPSAASEETAGPAPAQTPVAPTVRLECEPLFLAPLRPGADVVCSTDVQGSVTTTTWSINGEPFFPRSDPIEFTTTLEQAGPNEITVTVCNEDRCASDSDDFNVPEPTTVTIECAPLSVAVGEPVECSADIRLGEGAFGIARIWTAAGGSPEQGDGDIFSTVFGGSGAKVIHFLYQGHHESAEATVTVLVTAE